MGYIELQNEIIKKYRMTMDEHSKCRSRMHVHPKQRRICKWHQKASAQATFDLLHEIGHCENCDSKMRRCEDEYYATQWAIDRCNELGIEIPEKVISDYQNYIYRELARGLRHNGQGYPSKEEMTLKNCKRRIM